jgi:hypothetical protein
MNNSNPTAGRSTALTLDQLIAQNVGIGISSMASSSSQPYSASTSNSSPMDFSFTNANALATPRNNDIGSFWAKLKYEINK